MKRSIPVSPKNLRYPPIGAAAFIVVMGQSFETEQGELLSSSKSDRDRSEYIDQLASEEIDDPRISNEVTFLVTYYVFPIESRSI